MLEVEEYGDGDAVAALSCGGVPIRSLGPILEHLRKSRRVIVPKFADLNLTPNEALPHLVDVLRRKRAEGLPIVGHSFGAYRAFQLALHNDYEVDSICAIGPMAHQPADWLKMYDRVASRIDSVETAVEYAVDMWFSDRYRRKTDIESRVAGWFLDIGVEALRSYLRTEGSGPDLRPKLSSIDVPVRLIVGEQDAGAPVDWSREIHERLPNSDLHIVEGCGHFTQFEAPEQTVELVREFLEAEDVT